MKKYYVIHDEEWEVEIDDWDVHHVIAEQFNGIKTKGEQQDVYDEIQGLAIDESYEYYNEYKNRNDLVIKRIG